MTRPPQRPEGALLQRAMDRLDLSARAAAQQIDGVSDTRLRQIVAGYEPLGDERYREVVARPRTLAKIAEVLDITPEQLEEAQRHDAAQVLRDRLAHTSVPDAVPDTDLATQIDWVSAQPWSAMDKQRIINQLMAIDQQAQRERRAAG